MRSVIFDFDENEELWSLSTFGFVYKMPYTLMLELKRHLRESGPHANLLIPVRKWYVGLEISKRQKIKTEYRKATG